MDRLPKFKDLVFERVHKELYLRLTKVIRVLGTKFDSVVDTCRVWKIAGRLHPSFNNPLLGTSVKVGSPFHLPCVIREVSDVAAEYRAFLMSQSGDGRRTKEIHAGIERLEWLVENWDDLEITGDVKSGYRLTLNTNT